MVKLYAKPLRVSRSSQDRNADEVGANLFVGNLDPEVDEKVRAGCMALVAGCRGDDGGGGGEAAVVCCCALGGPGCPALLVSSPQPRLTSNPPPKHHLQ